MDYDVAIVGYGPVGATLANLLGESGLSAAIVEAVPEIFYGPRAIVLDHEILRILQWCGLAGQVAALTAPHPGADYYGADGAIIKKFDPQPPPFPLGWTPNATFVQPELEAVLRSGVERYGDVHVFTPCEAVGIEQDEDGVSLHIRDGTGAGPRVVRARYLVGCDGASSFVRRHAGLGLEDLAFDEWWLVVDARLRRDVALPDKFIQYCSPSRPATFVIGPGNLRRWELKLLPGETPEDFADEAQIYAALAPFVPRDAIALWRVAVYRFHALVATEWRQGRIFIMGDAAHQMPPFLGQGLCAGIRDAANLFWKLDLVLRQGASDTLLDSYGRERKPHIREMVALSKAFGEIIGELDPAAARERDRVLREALESGRAETIRQKFIPDLTDGLIDRAHDGNPAPAAGSLFVQPWVRSGGAAPVRLDDLTARRFLIAASVPDVSDWLSPEARALWRELDGGIVAILSQQAAGEPVRRDTRLVVERGNLFHDWCSAKGCTAVVVRPDRYVYGIARDPAGLNRLVADIGAAILGG